MNEPTQADAVLEMRELYVGYYKDLNILQDSEHQVRRNQITAVLGANGVGKSTALRAAFGFLKPNAGDILLEGESILAVPTYNRILKGSRLHPAATRHLQGHERRREFGARRLGPSDATRKQLQQKMEANYERFPVLKEKRKQITGELSGGQQRMVEIGRTLMAEPKVLLVDEPTAGLSKMLSEEVYEMLTALTSRDNLTILLVDQEIRSRARIADYVYVLELGRNKFEGKAAEFEDLEKAFWVA